MPNDDETVRKARAERLRKQVERLMSHGDEATDDAGETGVPVEESPREFIHREMRERDNKEGNPV